METMIFKENILSEFQKLKNEKFGEVEIICNFQNKPYKLVLLTADCCEDVRLMELLSNWRKKHEAWFMAQFPISIERTVTWFKNKVTGASDRVLFMVEIDGVYVGHVGLFRFNFANLTCEIDNIVRGEDNVMPGIMGDAIINLMNWGQATLGIKNYTLQTFSNNERALRLYNRLGFVEIKRIPLIYQTTAEGGEWIEALAGYSEPIIRYDVYMELKK